MQLLVTTPRFVLLTDTSTRAVQVVESGRGEYYGVTWSPAGNRLALGHSNLDHDTLTDLASYALSEVGTVSVAGTNIVQPFLSAPHQILWLTANKVAATNTGRNTLAVIDVTDGSVIERRIGSAMWDRLSAGSYEGAHLNSLFLRQDTLYVVAHNFNKGSYISEWSWPGLDETAWQAVPGLSGIHNLMITPDDQWIVCDSMGSGLADGKTGTSLWSAGRQGYMRGLAATNQHLFVGQSELAGRKQRTATETGVWVVDRATMRTVDYLYLGHFGSVHEVRIVDEPDLAHHGVPLAPAALQALGARATEIADRRRQRAERAQAYAALIKPVVGSIDYDASGAISAGSDFAIYRIAAASSRGIAATLRFGHTLDRSAHISLVTRYAGPGDTNMIAALFQTRPNGELSASFWVNHGGAWNVRSIETLDRRHMRSTGSERTLDAALIDEGQTIRLEVAGETVLSLATDDAMPQPAPDGFALRFNGQDFKIAAVRPLPT